MHFLGKLRPHTILAISAAVAVLMVSSALVELRQSREELFHVMQENAFSLVETVERSAANNLLSSSSMEEMLADRLFNNASFIVRLDSLGRLSGRELQRIADENGLFVVGVYDARGHAVLSNSGIGSSVALPPEAEPIVRGDTDRVVIGVMDVGRRGEKGYAVGIKRTRRGGGAITVALNANELLAYRQRVGIGKLVGDLGKNAGVAYVALQDTEGILAASGAVEELSAIAADPFLYAALGRDSIAARVTEFRGSDVYEVVYPFTFEGAKIGLFRVGLQMQEIHAAEARMQRRVIIMSLVVIVIGVLAVTLTLARQSARLAEERYARVRAFSGNILREMQDAVVSVDASDTITVFNRQAERMLGIAENEALGARIGSMGGETGTCLRSVFAAAEAGTELTLSCPGGIQRIVSVVLSSTAGPGGTTESRTAVVRDLTHARQLEREAQRKERLGALGQLASGVAHEIRNPMNAIAMIAQRFENEFTPRRGINEYRSLTAVLRAETHRINQIIRQFLQFARPASLSLQKVDIREFTEKVALLFKGQADAKGIEFCHTVEGHAAVSIDPYQMTQALLNVLQNALDATPPGGRITLAAVAAGEQVTFTIRDTGTGISQERLTKIFDLYYTTKPEGTGMGLAITQQIVAGHGGRIEVSSSEGSGTAVVMVLPGSSLVEAI